MPIVAVRVFWYALRDVFPFSFLLNLLCNVVVYMRSMSTVETHHVRSKGDLIVENVFFRQVGQSSDSISEISQGSHCIFFFSNRLVARIGYNLQHFFV